MIQKTFWAVLDLEVRQSIIAHNQKINSKKINKNTKIIITKGKSQNPHPVPHTILQLNIRF